MTVNHGMLIVGSFLEYMVGWELGCVIYCITAGISGMGGAMTNAAIAYDRYRYVIVYLQNQFYTAVSLIF